MPGVQLIVDSAEYTGWESLTVTRSIEAAAGVFDLRVAESPAWRVRAGSRVQLLVDGALFMTGHVEFTLREISDQTTTIRLAGRDLTGDLIDGAAEIDGGEIRDIGILELAQILATPRGVDVAVVPGTVLGEPFAEFAVTPGEDAWSALERALRIRGLLAYPGVDGSLLIASPGLRRAEIDLVMGKNLLAASIRNDESERFREYRARGQRRGGDEDFALLVAESTGYAVDLGARANRALEIILEQTATLEDCDARARWEASVRAARASSVDVAVAGWRQDGGALWEPNLLARVVIPQMDFDETLLITAVTIEQGEEGARTGLTLRRKDAFQPEPEIPRDRVVFGELLDEEVP